MKAHQFFILSLTGFLFSCERYPGHMDAHRHMNYPYGGINMWLTLLLLLGIIALAVYFFLNRENFLKGEGALEILKKRYAKGEINEEQFEEMKKKLQE